MQRLTKLFKQFHDNHADYIAAFIQQVNAPAPSPAPAPTPAPAPPPAPVGDSAQESGAKKKSKRVSWVDLIVFPDMILG